MGRKMDMDELQHTSVSRVWHSFLPVMASLVLILLSINVLPTDRHRNNSTEAGF